MAAGGYRQKGYYSGSTLNPGQCVDFKREYNLKDTERKLDRTGYVTRRVVAKDS
jgi:hypothetical protein